MRNMLKTSRLLASLALPLLFACGSDGTAGGGLVMVPSCDATGQVLTTDAKGQLKCVAAPAASFTLPTCKKYSQALTADGSAVSCTDRNNEAQATTDALNNLASAETLISQYTTRLGNIMGGTGAAARAVYCGSTTVANATKGQFGGVGGIPSANATCQALCGATTARMCSIYDVYYSVTTGAITAANFATPAWVYTANLRGGTGFTDNCSGYTSTAGNGTVAAYVPTTAGAAPRDNTIQMNSTMSCNNLNPIACCK